MKKLFHRKKTSAPSSPDQTPVRSRPTGDVNHDPTLRTSRYESTTSAGLPQTGQYPLKGNNSSVALQGRRSETYSRGQASGPVEPSPRPSTSNPYYGSLPTPRVTSASYKRDPSAHSLTDGPSDSGHPRRSQQGHDARRGSPPILDFSNLNLESNGGQAGYDNPPLGRYDERSAFAPNGQDSSYPSTRHEQRGYEANYPPPTRKNGRAATGQPDSDFPQQPGSYNQPVDYGRQGHHTDRYGPPGSELSTNAPEYLPETHRTGTGNRPIARKEIAPQHPAVTNETTSLSSSPDDRTRHYPASPSARGSQPESHGGPRTEQMYQPRFNPNYSPRNNAPVGRPSAQEVVDRAGRNTYDTEVVEKVAPGMVK